MHILQALKSTYKNNYLLSKNTVYTLSLSYSQIECDKEKHLIGDEIYP